MIFFFFFPSKSYKVRDVDFNFINSFVFFRKKNQYTKLIKIGIHKILALIQKRGRERERGIRGGKLSSPRAFSRWVNEEGEVQEFSMGN